MGRLRHYRRKKTGRRVKESARKIASRMHQVRVLRRRKPVTYAFATDESSSEGEFASGEEGKEEDSPYMLHEAPDAPDTQVAADAADAADVYQCERVSDKVSRISMIMPQPNILRGVSVGDLMDARNARDLVRNSLPLIDLRSFTIPLFHAMKKCGYWRRLVNGLKRVDQQPTMFKKMVLLYDLKPEEDPSLKETITDTFIAKALELQFSLRWLMRDIEDTYSKLPPDQRSGRVLVSLSQSVSKHTNISPTMIRGKFCEYINNRGHLTIHKTTVKAPSAMIYSDAARCSMMKWVNTVLRINPSMLTAQSFQEFVRTQLNYPTFGLRSARLWMADLGLIFGVRNTQQKYADGHERADVKQYRQKLIDKVLSEFRQKNIYYGQNMECTLEPKLTPGQLPVAFSAHDETVCRTKQYKSHNWHFTNNTGPTMGRSSLDDEGQMVMIAAYAWEDGGDGAYWKKSATFIYPGSQRPKEDKEESQCKEDEEDNRRSQPKKAEAEAWVKKRRSHRGYAKTMDEVMGDGASSSQAFFEIDWTSAPSAPSAPSHQRIEMAVVPDTIDLDAIEEDISINVLIPEEVREPPPSVAVQLTAPFDHEMSSPCTPPSPAEIDGEGRYAQDKVDVPDSDVNVDDESEEETQRKDGVQEGDHDGVEEDGNLMSTLEHIVEEFDEDDLLLNVLRKVLEQTKFV